MKNIQIKDKKRAFNKSIILFFLPENSNFAEKGEKNR